MISLRKTVSELDQLDEFKRTAVECYADAITSVNENAVTVDSGQLEQFRERIQILHAQVKPGITAEQLRDLQLSFNAELREYSEQANRHIQRLRNDVRAASQAVETFAEKFTVSGADLDGEVKRELQRLDKAARIDDLKEVRTIINNASAGIASQFERMRSTNQLAIAQLKDEIRVLHQEIETARKWRSTAQSLDTQKQQEIFQQIDELLRQKTPFSLILVAVRNRTGLESCHPKAAIENALASMHVRFQNSLPKNSRTGCWADAQFIAVLTVEPATAMAMSRELAKKLSGVYVLEGARTVTLEVTAGVIDWKVRTDPSSLRRRLQQLSDALAQA